MHAHPLSLQLPSGAKLWYTIQLRGQIKFFSTPICTLWFNCGSTAGLSETKENPPGTGSATDTDFLAIFLNQKRGKIHIGEAQCGLFNTRAHLQIPGQKGNRSHHLQDEPKQKL